MLMATVATAFAAIEEHVQWEASLETGSDASSATLIVKAEIADGWHIYGLEMPDLGPDAGIPDPTTLTVISPDESVKADGALSCTAQPTMHFDSFMRLNMPWLSGNFELRQPLEIDTSKATTVRATVRYMACNESSCTPPARFDIDKAVSINAEHIRMLEPQDFLNRSVPYLFRDGVVSAERWDELTDRERSVLTAAAPLVQPRVRLLGEVAGMAGSLLSTSEYIAPEEDAKKQLKATAGEVLDAAIAALDVVPEADWTTDNLHETLNKALIEDAGYKPRVAFGPVRVAMSGRRVSPPLFESMEIVGKPVSIARLRNLREHLAEIQAA